jgi:hypothetical protein
MKAGNKRNSRKIKRKRPNKSRVRRILIFSALTVIFTPLLILYLYAASYYQKHFYSNTIINGIDTSDLTMEEAEDLISAKVKAYSLTLIGRNSVSDTITGESIRLHTVFEKNISDMLIDQEPYKWPVNLFKPHVIEVSTMLDYDASLLEESFRNLKFFKEENNVRPVNAFISEYGENGYEIIPENPGARVIEDKLLEAVRNAVDSLEPIISIEEADCYEKPEITSDYPDMVKAAQEMNKLAGAEITYEFGEDTEVLDGSKISEWITVDDNYQVEYDASHIKEFVDYIGKTYNSFGRVRTFKTSYGKVIKVKGGDYGWWLNRPKEVEEVTELVQNGSKIIREPAYFQTAQQYGEDDIGDTYVEINLTAQHLFFYKDGKLILQTDFVSGNVSKDYATPVGTYPVQYKENDAVLVGEDYETPVKYWMPFNRNIGMHDASWRSKFGGDIYLTNGSHGCINMPPKAAKKMFQNIRRGVAVVVYELPGTESYDKEKEKATDKK